MAMQSTAVLHRVGGWLVRQQAIITEMGGLVNELTRLTEAAEAGDLPEEVRAAVAALEAAKKTKVQMVIDAVAQQYATELAEVDAVSRNQAIVTELNGFSAVLEEAMASFKETISKYGETLFKPVRTPRGTGVITGRNNSGQTVTCKCGKTMNSKGKKKFDDGTYGCLECLPRTYKARQAA